MPRVFESSPVKPLECILSVYPSFSPTSIKSPVFALNITFDTGDSVRLASRSLYFSRKDMVTYCANKDATIVFKVNVETGETTYQYISPEKRKELLEEDPKLRHNVNFLTMDETQKVHHTHVTKLEIFSRDELPVGDFLSTLYPVEYYHPWGLFQDMRAINHPEPKKYFLEKFKPLCESLYADMPDDLFLLKLCHITHLIWSLPVNYGMPFNVVWSDFCYCSDAGAALRTKDIVDNTTIDNKTVFKFDYKE